VSILLEIGQFLPTGHLKLPKACIYQDCKYRQGIHTAFLLTFSLQFALRSLSLGHTRCLYSGSPYAPRPDTPVGNGGGLYRRSRSSHRILTPKSRQKAPPNNSKAPGRSTQLKPLGPFQIHKRQAGRGSSADAGSSGKTNHSSAVLSRWLDIKDTAKRKSYLDHICPSLPLKSLQAILLHHLHQSTISNVCPILSKSGRKF
jgi:hypothetical protein